MKLHQLTKVTTRSNKRVGRGLGSGKGKTSARGQKGQKARGKIPQAAVGGGLILYKKLPFNRGLGNRKVSLKPIPISLNKLSSFKPKSVVDLDALVTARLVPARQAEKFGVKILGGEISVALEVKLPTSSQAKKAIEKAGGSVV